MKRTLITVLILALACTAVTAVAQEGTAANKVGTPEAKLSYALGADIGKRMQSMYPDVDLTIFFDAMTDVLKGNDLLLTDEEMTEIRREFFERMRQEQQAKSKADSDNNKQEGLAFLAENKTKPGVATTASGLQYMVLSEGSGPLPKETDQVSVHYKGTLVDGTEFDSSEKRGKPATFPIKGVIKGWGEALQLMKVGGKFRLFIPPELAYGDKQAGPNIGPNSVLIFDVELLEIVDQPDTGKTPGAAAKPAGGTK